jgi:hypothetical protein
MIQGTRHKHTLESILPTRPLVAAELLRQALRRMSQPLVSRDANRSRSANPAPPSPSIVSISPHRHHTNSPVPLPISVAPSTPLGTTSSSRHCCCRQSSRTVAQPHVSSWHPLRELWVPQSARELAQLLLITLPRDPCHRLPPCPFYSLLWPLSTRMPLVSYVSGYRDSNALLVSYSPSCIVWIERG